MPETELVDTETGAAPTDLQVQQLIDAAKGVPGKGVRQTWRIPLEAAASGEPPAGAGTADPVVLTLDGTGVKLSRDGGVTAPALPIVVGSPAGGSLAGTYPNPTVSAAGASSLLPPGVIVAYGGPTAPVGWLLCDGSAVSRTTYAALYAAIGTAYGAGDGSATFNLPALVNRLLLGASAGRPIGQVGGSEFGPPHLHPVNLDHLHPPVTSGISSTVGLGSVSSAPPPSFSEDTHTHLVTPTHLGTTSVNSGAASNTATGGILPPFSAVNFIIRAGV